MIIAGFLANSITCFIGSVPPYKMTVPHPPTPCCSNRSKYSLVCMLSSLVGDKINANPSVCSLDCFYDRAFTRLFIIGNTNESVLPLPVSDRHNISFPYRLEGRDALCIPVGSV
jgi:hypothetical protein